MSGDYPLAKWLPSPNFWPGGDGNHLIVVHATASGGPQTGYQLATSSEFTDGKSKSVHYINDVDGTVYQIVKEDDSAWGNCCATGASPYDHAYNWNRKSISIENVKHSADNSESLTDKQYQSLLALIRDICQRQNIPLQPGSPTAKGVIFHHDLDPVNKARCPGTFPYATFMSDLKGGPPLAELPNYPVVDQLNSKTFDGKPDENAQMNCVLASLVSAALYYHPDLAGKISPDLLKDAVLGESYLGGTSITSFLPYVQAHWGIRPGYYKGSNTVLVSQAHQEIKAGRPVIFTETDPYAAGLTHVCVFFGEVPGGLKVMDPYHGKIFEKSDSAWASVLQSGEIWIVSKDMTVDYTEETFKLMWQSVVPTARLDSGIAALARTDFKAGHFHGPALTLELSGHDLVGTPTIYQMTAQGWYYWQNGKGGYTSYA